MDVYTKSNSIENVAFKAFSKVEANKVLASTENAKERQKNAQILCDYLCRKFKMPQCSVVVTERTQPHSTNMRGSLRSKTLGNYRPLGAIITIFNKTAVKRQTVSIKTFFDTLLHEFCHHYDYQYLKFGDSLHTAGFYKRISDLKNKLTN